MLSKHRPLSISGTHSTKRLLALSRGLVTFLSSLLLTFIASSLTSLPRPTNAAATPISCSLPHTLTTCLSLSANNVNLTMPPVASGDSFAYSTNAVNVKTNTPSYSLTLSTNSQSEASRSLTRTTTPATTIAPTTGTSASPSTLTPNTWGYTLTSSPTPSATSPIWSSIPTSTTPATLVTNGAANDTAGTNTNINYGVKIDITKEAGNYQTTLLYTATATPIPAPTATDVSPSYGPTTGGTVITITGANFYDTVAVTIGENNCTSFTVNSPTQMTCTTPPATAGVTDINIITENGGAIIGSAFTYINPPTITSTVTPGGSYFSGMPITITGTDLGTTDTVITINGIPCPLTSDPTNLTSTTTKTCTLPSLPAGQSVITVTTNDGSSQYVITYIAPVPMQTLTSANCPTTRTLAYDKRDNQVYYIQKIPNSGQNGEDLCWMETNLRYAGGGNWNNTWGYPDDRDNLTLRSSGTPTYTSAEYMNPGGSTDYTNTTPIGGFYGYLYNWCAAMGGQTNACNNTSTTGFDTTTSICPAGWRLPTGNTGGEFQTLNNTINGGNITSPSGLLTNFLAVYSGVYGNALFFQGVIGHYWSSTVSDTMYAYSLQFNANAVSISTHHIKNTGFAVRCILPPPPTLSDITYLQDATTELCTDTPLGTTVNLIDQRDNISYRVRKMVDNRCWMIDNLAYDINNAPAAGKPAYDPAPLLGGRGLSSIQAQYAKNNNTAGQGQIPNNGNPTESYLYNWCAAMGDTSTDCATTVAYTSSQPPTPQVGICPGKTDGTGFRLPRGGAAPSTPGNGTNQEIAAASTTNEFAKLDIWIGGTGTNRTSASTYSQWMGTGTTADNWSGVLSGGYMSRLLGQGSIGDWWSSTAGSGTNAYFLRLGTAALSNDTGVHPANSLPKNGLYAVRCVLGEFGTPSQHS